MTNPDLTALCLIIDRSGSMATIATDMNGGIRQLLTDQRAVPGDVMLDVFTFDTTIEHVVKNAVLADVPLKDYVLPRGGTALNDAIGLAVTTLGERFAAMPEEDRPTTVIVTVVTDGYENSSHEWTADKVKALVTQQTNDYAWVFMYLAANVDAFATGSALGFQGQNSMGYAATGAGAQSMSHAHSAAVTRTRGGTFQGYTDDERDAAAQA